MFVQVEKLPVSILKRIVTVDKVQIFAHVNVFLYRGMFNFVLLYHESISSPFLYLDIICRIAFNVSEKFYFPIFISGIRGDCTNFGDCTNRTCTNLKHKTTEILYYGKLIDFCLNLVRFL